ncbi:hypothetical protein ACTXT7_005576 [Hymenolepis weldensis]
MTLLDPLTVRMSIPISIIRLLGARYLFSTTTAGSLNPLFKVEDLVMVKGHVDFSSLVGNNSLKWSHEPRYVFNLWNYLIGLDTGICLTQEVLVAKRQRMKISALCLITNRVPTNSNAVDDHNLEAEMQVSKTRGPTVGRLIERIISRKFIKILNYIFMRCGNNVGKVNWN